MALALAVAIGAAPAQELRLVLPAGATRGTTATFRCYGRDLDDTVSVIWLRPGLEVVALEDLKRDRVTIKVRIPADAAPGTYPFALHTSRGITRAKLLQVGTMPSVAEAKEHGSRETAQRIELDTTVDGRILAEDIDWYAFDVAAGQAIRVEAEGVRLGLYDLDLQFEVFAPDGEMVLRSDDSAIGRGDPVAGFRAARAGTYHLALRDVAWRGSSSGAYRLHVGTFPRPTGVLPAGGRPGETIAVQLLGDLVPATAELQLPEQIGVHEVFPVVDGKLTPTPVRVLVDDRDNFVEGATPEAPSAAPCAFHGVIAAPDETDGYPFRAKKGERLEVRVLARGLLSPLDPVLIIRDANGKALSSNDDGIGLDGRVRFTAPADGTFQVTVRDHLRRGGADFFYRIEVGAISDIAGTAEAVPGRRSEDFGIAVPQGGRNATIVQVSGIDARDGITIDWTGLPAGVTVAPLRVPATRFVPVVVTGAGDAPQLPGLAEPRLRADAAPHERPAMHLHRYPTLRVDNNIAYSTRALHHLPVAVTAPASIAVHADTPKVPLVRSGTLTLPVRVDRADKFDGTVTVRALWLPAGVSASTLTLRKGQSTGELTLNGNSSAALGAVPFVLSASYVTGSVRRAVSTDVLTLDVQEPWITAKLPRAQMEQGQPATFAVQLERKREFAGEVRVELGRIPKGVTYTVPKIAADTVDLPIALQASETARPGRHRSIYMRLIIATEHGEIRHAVGGGEIRVDRPLPKDPGGAQAKGGSL
ncbi:MAG: PPC domain-containing protein [Planctomycetes bacterium]|nr:PPC domain-containing protein [Planctomycetota bacterium]